MSTRNQDDDHAVGAILRKAGARGGIDPSRRARVRQETRVAWQDATRARRRRRAISVGAVLAAGLAIALWPLRGGPPTTSADAPRVTTGAAERTTRALADGQGEWRLDEHTSIRITAPREIALDRGAVYFDDHGDAGAPPVHVITPHATITDLGTRFEVRLTPDGTLVRVRDGMVRVMGSAGEWTVAAGTEARVGPNGASDLAPRPIAPDDPVWSWTRAAARPFDVDGVSLGRFLDWACREGGWTLEFSRDVTPGRVRAVVLHGTIAGLSLGDAVTNMLAAAGLTSSVADARLVVSPEQGAVR
jgi:transmembrane sensor